VIVIEAADVGFGVTEGRVPPSVAVAEVVGCEKRVAFTDSVNEGNDGEDVHWSPCWVPTVPINQKYLEAGGNHTNVFTGAGKCRMGRNAAFFERIYAVSQGAACIVVTAVCCEKGI
jgi:hypothetical protein